MDINGERQDPNRRWIDALGIVMTNNPCKADRSIVNADDGTNKCIRSRQGNILTISYVIYG
jgi:hypothetical protein